MKIFIISIIILVIFSLIVIVDMGEQEIIETQKHCFNGDKDACIELSVESIWELEQKQKFINDNFWEGERGEKR